MTKFDKTTTIWGRRRRLFVVLLCVLVLSFCCIRNDSKCNWAHRQRFFLWLPLTFSFQCSVSKSNKPWNCVFRWIELTGKRSPFDWCWTILMCVQLSLLYLIKHRKREKFFFYLLTFKQLTASCISSDSTRTHNKRPKKKCIMLNSCLFNAWTRWRTSEHTKKKRRAGKKNWP